LKNEKRRSLNDFEEPPLFSFFKAQTGKQRTAHEESSQNKLSTFAFGGDNPVDVRHK
jgi:hypothetical protein